MLRYIADTGEPYEITLLYSNRDRESSAFLDELADLEARIQGLRVVLTMTDDDGWEGERRRIDEGFLRDHVGDLAGSTFLVAGPPGMAEGVSELIRTLGVPEERVKMDRFAGY
jgi:ferredoxin-NADP reductase